MLVNWALLVEVTCNEYCILKYLNSISYIFIHVTVVFLMDGMTFNSFSKLGCFWEWNGELLIIAGAEDVNHFCLRLTGSFGYFIFVPK